MPALISPRGLALMVALLPLFLSRSAVAQDRVSECVAAHSDGQLLRNQGRLLAAKGRFSECQAGSCPVLVRDECIALGKSVDQALPSVVFGAIDEAGKPTSEPALSIDGSSLVPLDGRPVSLDPGPHRVRFQRRDGKIRDVELILAESEHGRRVFADFRPPPGSAGAGHESSSARTVVFVSAGAAALALGSFTYFALSGRAIQRDLERCKPNCENRDDLERMRARYLVADVSLGLALVSIGVGAVIWAKNPAAVAQGRARSRPGLALSVQPRSAARGVELSARGEF